MRSFRRDIENLRDTRIVYMFLISFAIVCAVLVSVVTHLDGDLKKSELEGYYESLTLCAHALEAWEDANSAEERYAASLRFENAAASLPSEVSLEPMLSLVNYMRMGESASERVRAFADTFALLGAVDYANAGEARRIIREVLDGVSNEIFFEAFEKNNTAVSLPPQEVLSYTKRVAQTSLKKIFGKSAAGLVLIQDELGSWVSKTDNMRISFSGADGSIEAFVFIRIGENPTSSVSEKEAISSALEFYAAAKRRSGSARLVSHSRVCGFTVCDISDGEDSWRATVDNYGRVWSLMKVKR